MASGGTASPASDHSRRIAVREPGAPPPPPLGASGAGVVALGDVGVEAFVIGSVPLLLVPAGQGLRAPSAPEDPRKIHFASGRRCRRPGLTRRPTGLDRNLRDHRSRPRTSEGGNRNPQERPAGHLQMADYRQPGRGAGSPDAFNGYRHRCDHPRTAPGAPAASGRRSRWSRVASPSVITAPETISEGIADRLARGTRPRSNSQAVPSIDRACPVEIGDRPRPMGLVRLLKIVTVDVSPLRSGSSCRTNRRIPRQ